jgi:hypothetical protein
VSSALSSVSAATGLRLSCIALAISVLCFAVHASVYYLHAPLALPTQVLTFLGVFGLTWPLWGYAAAMYRRALTASK